MAAIVSLRSTVVAAALIALLPLSTGHAQGLPPSLPLAQPFGVPESEGGAPSSAVQFSLPLRSLWHNLTASRPPATPAPVGQASPARPAMQVNWSLAADMSLAMAQARTGTTSLSAPLLGSAGILRDAPQVGGGDPFSTIDYRRAPTQSLGLRVSYGLTDIAGRGLSLSGAVGLASFTAGERPRAPVGTTSLKLSF